MKVTMRMAATVAQLESGWAVIDDGGTKSSGRLKYATD